MEVCYLYQQIFLIQNVTEFGYLTLLEKEYLNVSIDWMVVRMDMLEFSIASVLELAVLVVEVGIVVEVTTNKII